MSFMTMTMFAPRIWEYDFSSPRARVALEAGWRRSDLLWESLMEAGCAACAEGRADEAVRAFRRAWWVARLFPKSDLRRAACMAALGVVTQSRRRVSRARAQFATLAAEAVEAMQIAPRARSSLFHLRMEARHRETYHGNLRLRLSKIAGETEQSLAAMEQGRAPAHRLYSRWLGERPTVYDDTRKVLSACLLIPGG